MKTTKSYEDLSSPAFQQRLKDSTNAALLDVRTSQEFREGHIPDSINLDVMDTSFHKGIKSLDKSKTYFVYCRSGGRSRQACAILADLGFTAINLAGGIMAWTGKVIWRKNQQRNEYETMDSTWRWNGDWWIGWFLILALCGLHQRNLRHYLITDQQHPLRNCNGRSVIQYVQRTKKKITQNDHR